MEVADGDLLTHIDDNGAIPEPQAQIWTSQIMSALGVSLSLDQLSIIC